MDIVKLFEFAVSKNASDIVVAAGSPPLIRLAGEILPASESPLTHEEARQVVYSVMKEDQRARFEQDWELDFSFSVPDVARMRGNVFLQQRGLCAVFRVIPGQIPAPEELGLTQQMAELADLPRGLVLVTGPTGSGKSTTLASLVQSINRKYCKSIITIEDPIEYVYQNRKSLVLQREVNRHTKSFAEALRRAMRQAPDVILIGEMRDLETIQYAISAAETGHLCLATLHTQDCASTVDRMVDVFPTSQQQQIRTQLALTLKAVLSQVLLPRADGTGRIAAREFMVMTTAISSLIRENKAHMIYSALESGGKYGMTTLDKSLARLAASGVVTPETAQRKAHSPETVLQYVNQIKSGYPV
ncbi:MAG: type IV pilus twitching motility protein PilT [Elusimicrobiaceae bacterium]|nr:type IV pilus twitching motility protein PilT [Elusimicrobiaceae bacterium]